MQVFGVGTGICARPILGKDRNRENLEQRAIVFFTFAQSLFHALALRNVADQTDGPYQALLLIQRGIQFAGKHRPVFAPHRQFQVLGGRARGERLRKARNGFGNLGFGQKFREPAAFHVSGRDPENVPHRRGNIVDDALHVGDKDHIGHLFGNGAKFLFTFAQRLLGPFAFGDVAGDAKAHPCTQGRRAEQRDARTAIRPDIRHFAQIAHFLRRRCSRQAFLCPGGGDIKRGQLPELGQGSAG